jgi:hypothetical protein
MEKIQNIIENNLDNSKKFESLEEELLDYEFQYIEKIDKGTLRPLSTKEDTFDDNSEERDDLKSEEGEDKIKHKITFEELIYKYSNFRSFLSDEYCKKMGNYNMYANDEERKKFYDWYDIIMKDVVASYESGDKNWRNNVSNIFRMNIEKLVSIPEEENNFLKRDNTDEKRSGLIHYNIIDNVEGLEKFKIDKNNKCISIHFKNLSKQKDENGSIANIFSGESLSGLAVDILEKYPYVDGVFAYSWLVSSPIGKRIGFETLKEDRKIYSDDCFWGQFINEKGEINKERMKRFLDTGIPDFYPKEGFIEIKKFLEYLPDEKKGPVHLKQITEESKKFAKDVNRISIEMDKKWEQLSAEDIISLINSNPLLASYFETQNGQEYIRMIKSMKESGIKKIDDSNYPNKQKIHENLRKYIEENSCKFTEKREVFIEKDYNR